MDHSVTFARHFSRLVWLIMRKPGEIDKQKAELRALVTISRSVPLTLAVRDGLLTTNAQVVPTPLAGAEDVAAQMEAHGLAAITVDGDALPADVLGVARLLAGMPVLNDGGAAAEAKRLALGASTVRFAARLPDSASTANAPSVLTTAHTSDPISEFDFGEVFDDPLAEAKLRETPRQWPAVPKSGERPSERRTGLFAQFAAARLPTETSVELLARLDVAVDGDVLADLLEDLVLLAENAAREGKATVVSDILSHLGRREARVDEFEIKRIFSATLKQLARPNVLRLVATELPHRPDGRDALMSILVRAGEDGADALVEQLAAMSHTSDRRVYFDALRELKAGVPTLVHMLADSRWFVARTAAELLGEMQVPQAEGPLTDMLTHEDERARRAASTALMRLGTPRAMLAIDGALKDTTPQARIDAAAAMATRKDLRTAATLIRALDAEKDEEVRAAFLLSLGKLKTPDAVQRLLQASDPARGLFKKKTTAFRIAAIQGLGEARTAEAMEALRALQNDKAQDVRDAATYALGRIARTSGGSGGPASAR